MDQTRFHLTLKQFSLVSPLTSLLDGLKGISNCDHKAAYNPSPQDSVLVSHTTIFLWFSHSYSTSLFMYLLKALTYVPGPITTAEVITMNKTQKPLALMGLTF